MLQALLPANDSKVQLEEPSKLSKMDNQAQANKMSEELQNEKTKKLEEVSHILPTANEQPIATSPANVSKVQLEEPSKLSKMENQAQVNKMSAELQREKTKKSKELSHSESVIPVHSSSIIETKGEEMSAAMKSSEKSYSYVDMRKDCIAKPKGIDSCLERLKSKSGVASARNDMCSSQRVPGNAGLSRNVMDTSNKYETNSVNGTSMSSGIWHEF